MMKKAPMRTVPCTVGRSLFWMASNARRPTPGMLKTVSVRIAPPRRMPRSRPRMVTIGVIAERDGDDYVLNGRKWWTSGAMREKSGPLTG